MFFTVDERKDINEREEHENVRVRICEQTE